MSQPGSPSPEDRPTSPGTADNPSPAETEVLFSWRGEIRSHVVGRQFYRQPRIFSSEQLQLVRERDNPYDQNAIAVLSREGVMIGHIGRRLASLLADKMDCGLIRLRATAAGPRGRWRSYIYIDVFGRSHTSRLELELGGMRFTPLKEEEESQETSSSEEERTF